MNNWNKTVTVDFYFIEIKPVHISVFYVTKCNVHVNNLHKINNLDPVWPPVVNKNATIDFNTVTLI